MGLRFRAGAESENQRVSITKKMRLVAPEGHIIALLWCVEERKLLLSEACSKAGGVQPDPGADALLVGSGF